MYPHYNFKYQSYIYQLDIRMLEKLKDDIFWWIALLSVIPIYLLLILYIQKPLSLPTKFNHLWSTSFLFFSFLYPVLEEIIFRGALQSYAETIIKKNIWTLSYANILTSIIFCSLHFIYHPTLWAISVFVPSIIFGHFRDKYNSLTPPIILHIFYNASYFSIFGI